MTPLEHLQRAAAQLAAAYECAEEYSDLSVDTTIMFARAHAEIGQLALAISEFETTRDAYANISATSQVTRNVLIKRQLGGDR